jgi:hypothetical protein
MARDLQKVEKDIRDHIKALNKEARMWERTLARAQHTRIGSPRSRLHGGRK